MKRNKENLRKFVGAGVFLGLAVAFVTVILVGKNVGYVLEDQLDIEREFRSWKHIDLPFLAEAPGADADPGEGASGVCNAYVSKLTETYASNLTDVWGSTNTNNTSAGTDIPYSTEHELCVKVRWNKTHAYDTAWNLSLVRAYVNCSTCDPSVSAVAAEETQIGYNDTYIWVNYHIDNADAGYSIARGGSVGSVSWNFEYYG